MKYKKKLVIVEAYQWFPNSDLKGVYCEQHPPDTTLYYYVITIHNQKAFLEPGDWIITEPGGIHYYPCKPDIFNNTYESVN